MKYILHFTFFVFTASLNNVNATDKYWIGNGGNWSEASHWSNTSGGTSCNCIPTLNDNVFFNASSFSSNSQTVNINQEAYCKSMNWTGAVSSSTFSGSSILNIYGSLILNTEMNVTYNGDLYFKSNSPGNTIQTFGKALSPNIYFTGLGGEWVLQDDLTTSGLINLTTGSLKTNNVTVNANYFQSTGSGIRLLTLGASTINVSLSYDNYPWNVSGSNLTVSSGTSTINLTGRNDNDNIYFVSDTRSYYDVNFTGGSSVVLSPGSSVFHNVSFTGNGNISGTPTFNNVSFASDAYIGGAGTYNNLTLGTSATTTISGIQTIKGVFTCNGTADVLSSINGGTLSKSSGTVCVNYVSLTNSTVTGGDHSMLGIARTLQ